MLVQEGTTELSLEPQHWGAFLYEGKHQQSVPDEAQVMSILIYHLQNHHFFIRVG